MKCASVAVLIPLWLLSQLAFAQTTIPKTPDELAAATALSKAQQAYYDQLLATAKSQQAATDANVVNSTASLGLVTQLQQAQMTQDLALASALKASGLTASTGKEGSITITSADKTLLALQRSSLAGIDNLATHICTDLKSHSLKDVFVAPQNYETLVEKSVPDVIQLSSLNAAAIAGMTEFATVKMQVVGTAIAGALISAQYIAGGVEALTKLFRSDYAVAISSNTRANLLEQRIAASCESGTILYDVEGQLRINASTLLATAIFNMAKFVQLNDEWNDQVTATLTGLTTQRAAVVADNKLKDAEKKARLKQIDDATKALSDKQAKLAKFKTVAAAMKTYLTGLNAQSTIYDSLVWGQSLLIQKGGFPRQLWTWN